MQYQLAFSALVAVTAASKCKPGSSSQAAGSSNATANAQSLYGQCGGQGWTGPTACAAGASCNSWNPYYHQCIEAQTTFASVVASSPAVEVSTISETTPTAKPALAAPAHSSQPAQSSPVAISQAEVATSAEPPVATSIKAAPAVVSSASSSVAVVSNVASSAAPSASASSAVASSGTVYKASFTQYGSTDTWGSGTCNTNTAACGFYSNPGYNAAISQNFFGVGPGAGAGPGCGTCWALTPSTDSSNNALTGASSIVIKVNNLCPASGNPLCSQSGTTGTNQYGANVNFDLCIDDKANTALFGSSNVGLAVGTATQVDCSQWSGTDIKKRMTI